MSSLPKRFLTPEEYLKIERAAEFKSEFHEGEMFAMAGASPNHNLIVGNVVMALGPQMRSRNCRTYPTDQRVYIPATGLYTYPDIVFVCDRPEFLDGDTLLNPSVIIEVLSPSTEAYNRGRKFEHYRSLPSLREYILIASERISVDLFSRSADEKWVLCSAQGGNAVLEIPSVGAVLKAFDIYADVEFEGASATPSASA